MLLINKIKLSLPLHVRPGDTLNLTYDYKDSRGASRKITKKLDTFDKPETIDTVLVYRTESGEFGLKGGRALIIGEDDGTHESVAPDSPAFDRAIGGTL